MKPLGKYHLKVRELLEEAHLACFKHPDRDVLGMSSGPFSGVNQTIGIVMELEERIKLQSQELLAFAMILKMVKQSQDTPEWVTQTLDWNQPTGEIECLEH